MSISHEIHVDAQVPRRASLFSRLRPIARSLFRFPGLRALHPLARRVLAVAEPAGRLSWRATPSQPVLKECGMLTVLSANLWHDWPRRRGWPQRLEALAQLVEAEGADIVLLQEVARTPALRADEWLARRLGMAYAYARANGHEAAIGFEELVTEALKMLAREKHVCVFLFGAYREHLRMLAKIDGVRHGSREPFSATRSAGHPVRHGRPGVLRAGVVHEGGAALR